MPELALVSRGWLKVISQLVKDHEAADMYFPFETGSEDEVNKLYATMELHGSLVKHHELKMGERTDTSTFVVEEDLDGIDEVEIDWDRVFRCCPKLLRLELGSMPLHSVHLGAILAAASTHCPHTQALILLLMEFPKPDHEKLQPNFVQLTKALERWYKGSLNLGLLQLTVPHRFNRRDDQRQRVIESTDAYLTAIATFCPNLEHFDAWDVTNAEASCIYSGEMVFSSLSAWKNFCKSTTKLRGFSWFTVLLDNRYLQIFGKYPKPQLATMTLGCGNESSWSSYLRDAEYLDPRGFRFSAKWLGEMLAVSPALKRLSIPIDGEKCWRMEEAKSAINDDFLVALAQHCKDLEILNVNEFICHSSETPEIDFVTEGSVR